MHSLTLSGFIQTTLEVLQDNGIDTYLPTIIPLGSPGKPVICIKGIPEEVDHRDAIQQVILEAGLNDSEFFFCVRNAENELVGGHYRESGTDFFGIRKSPLGYVSIPAPACDWWHIRKGNR